MDKISRISAEKFEASIQQDCHYEGWVDDIGYVYWEITNMNLLCPSYPNNNSIYYTKGTNFVSDPAHILYVIPEKDILDSIEISTKDIMEKITRKTSDGKMVVTFPDGSEFTMGSKDSTVSVTDANELFDGKETRVITITAEDKATGKKKESKIPLKSILDWMGDDDTLAGIIGIASSMASLGAEVKLIQENFLYLRSLAKAGKFLGTKYGKLVEMDKTFLSTKRTRLTRGAEQAKFVKNVNGLRWVRGIGTTVSWISVFYSGYNFIIKDTNWENGINLGIAASSLLWWEVGVTATYVDVSMQWSREKQQQTLQILDMNVNTQTKALLLNTLPINPTGPCP